MPTESSLLASILLADADGIVLHVGEPPALVTAAGTVELSPEPLSVSAVLEIIDQLVPAAVRHALRGDGAVEYPIRPLAGAQADAFTVAGNRTGDDLWVEIRRDRVGAPSRPATTAAVPESGAPPSDAGAPVAIRLSVVEEAGARVEAHAIRDRPFRLQEVLDAARAAQAESILLIPGEPPHLHVAGEVHPLAGAPAVSASAIETAVVTLGGCLDAYHPSAWTVGDGEREMECLLFRERRGRGVRLRVGPATAADPDRLEQLRPLDLLCREPEGLLLFAAPADVERSVALNAALRRLASERRGYVIVLGAGSHPVEQSAALVSQRWVTATGLAGAVQDALREDPDVLAVTDIGDMDTIRALRAAGRGRLILARLASEGSSAALRQWIDAVPEPERLRARAELADQLRGIVFETWVRKPGGGRVAVCEVGTAVPALVPTLAAGQFEEFLRRGAHPHLNESLLRLVQRGTIRLQDAWRRSPDREALLAAARAAGLSTAGFESRAPGLARVS